jgi:hypothetical protein
MSPKQLSMQTLLDAIQALGIDVPIMRVEEDQNGAITIHLYGGEVKHWPPAATAEIAQPEPMHNFTPPPVTRSELIKSQRAKKSQTKTQKV